MRLPQVAVGLGRYLAWKTGAPTAEETFSGSFVDLSGNFTDHQAYVNDIRSQARQLVRDGYLLVEDAARLVAEADSSAVGR